MEVDSTIGNLTEDIQVEVAAEENASEILKVPKPASDIGESVQVSQPATDVGEIMQISQPAANLAEVTATDLNLSDGFDMMQPYWEKFRKDIERKAAELKDKNDREMEMKQLEIDDLIHRLDTTTKEHENQIALMKNEYEESIRDIKDKHTIQLESLKERVRFTLNDAGEESQLGGIKEGDGISGLATGSGFNNQFQGDVSAEGDFFAGNKYAVKSTGEGNTAGLSDMLENFGASASQAPAKQSASDASEVNVKLDGATMTGNQNVVIDHKSVKINIGSGGRDDDRQSSDESDDDANYESLQDRELERRVQRWKKRTRMKDAIAFKGPNERIIELVFEDKREEYFDYLIQDVLPKFEETQLQKIAPYIERYSVIDLTQRKYDYRYLQVFFYCSPRTEFESLLMKGNHVESKDIRNLVKALDSRQRPTHIKLIDLSDCKFDTAAFIELECLLAYTTHVNLSGLTESTVVYPNKTMEFSPEHAFQIAKTIERQEQKSFVNLSRCTLTRMMAAAFSPMMSKLKMLTLRYCNIDVEAMAALMDAIYQTKQLKILDLCETRIEPQSFGAIAYCLGIVRCLFLSSVMLREEGLSLLSSGLPQIEDGGMECLDVSFNPLNQDIITALTETAVTKIKSVIFSREQIQSPVHQEKMKQVQRNGKVLAPDVIYSEVATPEEAKEITSAEPKETTTPDENGQSSNVYQNADTTNTEQNISEVNVTQQGDEYFFWVLTDTGGEIPRGSQKYIASTTQDEINRRTLRNTWYQCFKCGTNVAFYGDKIDLTESRHFLRDRKFFGLYQNSHSIIVTRAEIDTSDEDKQSSSILTRWKESGVGKAIFEGKHNCNMTCSVNGMFFRTYKCRSCKESLGMRYFHKQQIPGRLNNIWCLLQENPQSLVVGATTKFVRDMKSKRNALGQSVRAASSSLSGGRLFQAQSHQGE